MARLMDRMRSLLFPLVTLIALAFAGGCKHATKPDFSAELPPGQLALRKIPTSEYPDFSNCAWNLNVLGQSIDHSIEYMNKPSAKTHYPYLDIDHARALASLKAFRALIEEAKRQPNPGQYVDQQIRANFEVYKSIGAPNTDKPGYSDTVLFTGYCTPDRDASLVRTGPFQFPVYRKPKDLVADPVSGETIGRRMPDGKTIPYYTRQEIETGNVLAGQELAFVKSRWEAYIVTIQGSARLKLLDGKIMEIGFAGHNGYDYTSPGRAMVADGVITKEQLNLRSLGAYFVAHPEAENKYLNLNKRTVFFVERPGIFGSLNVPVTTFATLATDKQVYPRAMPAFCAVPVPLPDNPDKPFLFSGFLMDQDSGGAIRAAGRADIYMGIGDKAEAQSGHQMAEGALYYIAVKPELVGKYGSAAR
jgi:membrane-bound lytic murein transglycosylase A